MLDDLHGDDSLAALLKDTGDVGEGSVEKPEASGLHVAGPGLELYHRVGIYLEALEVLVVPSGLTWLIASPNLPLTILTFSIDPVPVSSNP